jgi:hypothetical protein
MKRKQTDFFMDFGDDQDPRSIKNRAALHEQHRHRVIATILVDLHLMAAAGILPDNCIVGAERAYWQDFSGSETKGTEAAHCVPCQIRITGKRPEQYVRKYSVDRAEKIAAYFGKTDKFLPVIFNKCDSQAERLGLVDAFWDACLEVVNSGLLSGTLRQQTVVMHIKSAFSLYKGLAVNAFSSAIKHFEGNRIKYALSSPDRSKEAATQVKVIQYYNSELSKSTVIQDITGFGEMKELIDLYKKFKRK